MMNKECALSPVQGLSWGKVMKLVSYLRRRRAAAFARDERGAVTVEAVLWLPLFIGLFALLVDATMIMSGRAQALRVIQDTNRGISVGHFQTIDDAEEFLLGSLRGLSPNVTVETVVNSGVIVTNVVMPSSDLIAAGLLDNFVNMDVRVGAQHFAEF